MTAKPRYSLLAVCLIIAFLLMFSLDTTAQDSPSSKVNMDPVTRLPDQKYMGDGGITYGCTTCHSPYFPNGFDYVSDVTIYFATGHKNTLSKTRGAIYPTTTDPYGSGSIFDWIDGVVSVGTGAPTLNTNPANQYSDGSYEYYGTTRPLYYVYGGWANPTQLETIFQNGFTGQLYPNGTYDCARCHTTGYNFDASGPEPTTAAVVNPTIFSYNFTPIPDAAFSRIPTDGYIAPGTNGTSSWYLTGVQCERCHFYMSSVENQAATALCLECHREETVDTIAHTIKPGNGLTGSAYSYLLVSDHGSCSDPTNSNYTSCITAGKKWNYVPSLDHAAGPTFLNSPHARFSGTLTQNRQNSPDLSVAVNGTYSSQFTDAMVRTAGDPTKNGGCVGCHDPHVTTVNQSSLGNNNAAGSYNEDHPPNNCNDCHALSQTIMQTVAHPFGAGTPFPTGTAADVPGSCAVCHMRAASGTAGSHLFRISVDPNYSTFPTAAQLYSPTNPQTTPNTASDGTLASAVWLDVDIACGQCHVGGTGSGNPYGLVVPPGSTNARYFTKAQLADIAANGYMEYYGSGPIHGPDPTTAAPTFSPAPGTYNTVESVTLSDATPGAAIYYTTDGTTPTVTSTPYTGTAIAVSTTTTIKAIAWVKGYQTSNPNSAIATYTLQAAQPTLSLVSGTCNKNGNGVCNGTWGTPVTVQISDTSPGVTIYYTTNGTTPTTGTTTPSCTSPCILGPFSTTTTIEAIASGNGFNTSSPPATSASYTIDLPPATVPTIRPIPQWGPLSTVGPQTINIWDTQAGVTIYYTTNGTTPTTSSLFLTGCTSQTSPGCAVLLSYPNTTVEAMATYPGNQNSNVTTSTYTYLMPPTFSPGAGTFSSSQTVTLSDTTPGAPIYFYYTLNGSPATTSSTLYKGPFQVSTTTTINAVAYLSGTTSADASGTYIINPSEQGGSNSSNVTVAAKNTAFDVQAGQSTSFPVTFSGASADAQILATCPNLPAGATCSYDSPSQTVTIGTSTTTPPGSYQVTVVFTIAQPSAALRHRKMLLASWTGLLGLPVGLLWVGGRRKKLACSAALALLGLWFALSLASCGGGGTGVAGSSSTTTPQTASTQSSLPVTLNVH